jgi:outer membrane lipoprotein LolB
MIARAACLCALLTLSGCANLMPKKETTAQKNWEAHRSQVEQIDRFVLKARVSSGGMFGLRGDLRWQQNADGSFDARISGPFGIGALTITGSEPNVEVRTKSGVYKTADPEKWIKDKMGWSFPIFGLRHWVLGLPSPHSTADMKLTEDGQLETLDQDGWHLAYDEYADDNGLPLPRKLSIANDDVKIKVVVDGWEGLPAKVAKR